MMNSVSILNRLIAYPTVSRDSNLELIDFVANFLNDAGAECALTHNAEKTKANLYVTLGSQDTPGVMLSGHTDVVPVDGQNWSSNPFEMKIQNGRLLGRGTADMKGFIACVLSMSARIRQDALHTPIHLAFSYDEEIGCVGVRRLIDTLSQAPVRPRFCIVGEPTSMQIVRAHKGKIAGRVICTGKECHSSLAPAGLNAIYLANKMISAIMALQSEIESDGHRDLEYDVAYTTLHVGVISGGSALNIVPNECRFEFEIRHLPDDSADELVERIEQIGRDVAAPYFETFPDAAISVEVTNSYPALDTLANSGVVDFVKSLTGANSCGKISFGTEGGLYSDRLGIETVVLGPGNIVQAHKPDEFVEVDQLQQCDNFLDRLGHALSG